MAHTPSTDELAPSLDDLNRLARAAWGDMDSTFRALAGDVIIRIEDFAEDDVLDAVGVEDPYELTGLYHGVDLTQRSLADTGQPAPMVFLYRRPILEEWIARGDVTLAELVAHVLVHEIGHHFGLSDEAMDRILENA